MYAHIFVANTYQYGTKHLYVCISENNPAIVSPHSLLVFFHYSRVWEARDFLKTYLIEALHAHTIESRDIADDLVVACAPKSEAITLQIVAHILAVVAYLVQIVVVSRVAK